MTAPQAATPPTPTLVRQVRHGEGGRVVELVLDRPDALNAISTALAEQIRAATEAISADPTVRAVVLSSAVERAFCVGADLKERAGFTDDELRAQRDLTRGVYTGVLELPMPSVAAVEGFALGGGLELALSCDVLVAGERAQLALPEVSVGLIPGGGGTQLLMRRVGWSRAAALIFSARRIDAVEGHRLGVVDELTAPGAAREQALDLAAVIARHSPVGVRNAKRAMRLGSGVDLASGLEIEDAAWRRTAFSADRREGVAAFAEKRPAVWPSE